MVLGGVAFRRLRRTALGRWKFLVVLLGCSRGHRLRERLRRLILHVAKSVGRLQLQHCASAVAAVEMVREVLYCESVAEA